MSAGYNRFAGQNHERLAALSDGIFAVALTLLVLDLHVPASEPLHQASEGALWGAIVALSPRLLTYFMSFLTLGIFWVAQQTQLNYYVRSDRTATWIHLAFLLAVTLVPFSTGLLAEYITNRISVLIYWINLLLLGFTLYFSLQYAYHARLVTENTVAGVRTASERRIIVFQVLYALGALLCVFNTYWSIGAIVLLQLISALAPRIGPLDRI